MTEDQIEAAGRGLLDAHRRYRDEYLAITLFNSEAWPGEAIPTPWWRRAIYWSADRLDDLADWLRRAR